MDSAATGRRANFSLFLRVFFMSFQSEAAGGACAASHRVLLVVVCRDDLVAMVVNRCCGDNSGALIF
jgi:hypothetical protein